MKKTLIVIAIMMLVVMIAGVAQAANDTATQAVTITVHEVAKLTATDKGTTISIDAPDVGGDDPKVTLASNDNTCGYTSVVGTNKTRKLTATADVDTSTSGLTLTLVAAPPSDCGTASTAQTLTTATSVDLIASIGSCKTNRNTVTLTYGCTVTDVKKLNTGSIPVTVTLTLTDEQ